MKITRLLQIALALGLFAFVACGKDEESITNSIEGTYKGIISFEDGLKSVSATDHEGTAVITKNGDDEIQVHCYGADLDTIFMLNYFEHNDSILVCLTGEEFQHHYGHRLGQGHMNGGGMIEHSTENETPWAHHLNDEHQEGDEHFGGFHMGNNAFNYSIRTEQGYYHFEGQKQ